MSTVVKDLGAVSAYAYAVEKGYTGTEAEFAELMASYATVGQTAVTAAQTATTKASEAATSAIIATNKASEATTAAQTASTKASEAVGCVETATQKATEATQSASQASGYAQTAETAKTDAQTAKTQAETARDNAVTAKTAAETAQGKAEDAQEAAEDAAESVSASAAQITTNAEDITQLKEDLTQKANIDGSYEDLVSGGAYQIISNMEEVDNTPYGYRTAGGSLEIGDREKLKKIVGGSLAVNQLAHDFIARAETLGITITVDNTKGSITASGTATATNNLYFMTTLRLIQDHKYLFKGSKGEGWLGISGSSAKDTGNGAISNVTATMAEDNQFIYGFSAGDVINETLYPQVFDLTQMFGTTIADYVYTLETATAGAGVAWLKSHFPRIFDSGYIPYNAGTLEHVSGLSAHKMVGFNQWDEEWQNGFYGPTGGFTPNVSYVACKNKIPVLPNTQYCISSQSKYIGRLCFYDADENFVSTTIGIGQSATTYVFTTQSNVHYMTFDMMSSYGTTYNHDICINLHWDGERDGEYEPYEEHSYPLDSDVTLRGIPKLDANNNLYYDGDEYAADGTVTRKYGLVDLGTLTWVYESSIANKHFLVPAGRIEPGVKYQGELFSTIYIGTKKSYNTISNMEMCVDNSADQPVFRIRNDSYTDAATFKAAMSGVYLVYELATPTTESADPYIEIQNVSNWGTEEFVTDALVPVGHETAYQPDLRAKIEVAPESPDTDGLYLMKRENGQNSYVAYLGELPTDPTTDGTYTLKCTVASGTATKTWEADE